MANLSFIEELKLQRWDDHRFYHQSRINQSLHLVSALSFLYAYSQLLVNPAIAGLVGWLVSMVTRQSGHFFFEPRDYDHVNNVTDEYKEEVKVGYNIERKIVFLTIWAFSPLLLVIRPDLFGLVEPHASFSGFIHNVGLMWLAIGAGGLLFRTIHLFFLKGVQSGLAWLIKILTDPFHDVMLYWRSPLYLLKGELLDPMHHVRHQTGGAAVMTMTEEEFER